jgi:hypothetical protein
MASTPITKKIAMLVGQLVLAYIYGMLGIILTALQFIRTGPQKFFRRVERPTPPAQATDPVYGKHEMIKLKVLFSFIDIMSMKRCFRHLVSLCIVFQKVQQIDH